MIHTEEINGLRRKGRWTNVGLLMSFLMIMVSICVFVGGLLMGSLIYMTGGIGSILFYLLSKHFLQASDDIDALLDQIDRPLIDRLIERLYEGETVRHAGINAAFETLVKRNESECPVTRRVMDEVLIDFVPTFEHLLSLDYEKANDKLYGTIEQVFIELTEVVDLRVEKAQEAEDQEKEAFSAMASDQLRIDLDQIRLYKQRTMETL